MTNHAHQVDIDICMYELVEPEIPTDPIVERLNLVERENKDLKEKLKRIEGGEDGIGVACCRCRR